MTPRVSVIIRSYNRLPALCELVEALLAQRHDSFEIVVVDQSTERPPEAEGRLAALAADPRLRRLRFPPLGGARARNTGVMHMRGQIAVFIDDDDAPVGVDFLANIERPFQEDPACVGVTCRHVWGDDPPLGAVYRWLAPRLAMRFSAVLGLPDNFARYDRPLRGRHYVHGTGGAYRRSVFERLGGWDDDTPIEDETSLGKRMRTGLAPGEYLAFDPRAQVRRGFDLGGGLDKRRATTARYVARFLTFVHVILGRYHPVRVRLLWPLYVFGAWRFTLGWMWDDSIAHDTLGKKLLGSLTLSLMMPVHALRALWRVRFGRPPGAGLSVRERVGAGEAAAPSLPS